MARISRRPWRFWIASAILVLSVVAGLAVADASTTGEIGPALGITANGRMLHPVGRMTTVGDFPSQIVDAISHSSIWSSSAIFVVEDDSQDGADHVDSHRMPAFVISPWARHGAVVHTRYDQYSVLRTIELITGIDPLSLNDGLAAPMYDAFVSHGAGPDSSPYNVVAPTQNIGEINGSSAPLARRSNALPWDRIDQVPQEISDAILYASVHGAKAQPPPPGPNASPVEHARAVAVRSALARHANVRALLAGAGDG